MHRFIHPVRLFLRLIHTKFSTSFVCLCWKFVRALLLSLALLTCFAISPVMAQDRLFLPFIATAKPATDGSGSGGTGADQQERNDQEDGKQEDDIDEAELAERQRCGYSAEAHLIAQWMTDHPDQGRAVIRCNVHLSKIAQARAADMAARGYFAHQTPEGMGLHALLLEAGVSLPANYVAAPQENWVESIAAGQSSPAEVWSSWLASATHRQHLLGLTAPYADQYEVGIAHLADPTSEYGDYWVIITTPTPAE